MTASVRNVKTSYVTVNYVRQEIKRENKEEQLNQQETLEAKRTIRAERQVERTKTVSYLTRDTDGQRATIGRACSKNCREQERAIARRRLN